MVNIMGLDLGYVQTKAVEEDWECKFPSLVKRRSEVFVSGLEDSEGYLITGQNGTWNVGAKGSYDFKAERLSSESDIPKLLTALGLYKQETGKSWIDLVVSGLPVDDFKIATYRNDFTNRLRNDFRFGFGGVDCFIRIRRSITLPQSAGAFFDFILDTQGEEKDGTSASLASEDVLVLDIGGKSTDCCIMESARFSQDSFTVWQGVWKVHNELRKLIMKHHKYNMPQNKIDDVLRSGYATIGGAHVPVKEIIKVAVDTVFPELRDELSLSIPDFRRFSAILLCGGGAYVYGDYIKSMAGIPVIVIPEAEYANSNGYRKYGLLKWKEGLA